MCSSIYGSGIHSIYGICGIAVTREFEAVSVRGVTVKVCGKVRGCSSRDRVG